MGAVLTAGGLAVRLVLLAALCGCGSSYRQQTVNKDATPTLRQQVHWTIGRFKERDPTLDKFFRNSHAYVVFPKVAKGAFVVGGAHGEGEVYEKGKFIGRAELTQGSVGVAVGGGVYSEMIFLRDEIALANFKAGRLEFSGQASAVIVNAGGAAAADYENGAAVFVMPEAGLMVEAAVGGQGFKFIPLRE